MGPFSELWLQLVGGEAEAGPDVIGGLNRSILYLMKVRTLSLLFLCFLLSPALRAASRVRWASWEATPQPVLEGGSVDPSVIRDQNLLRMVVQNSSDDPLRPTILEFVSSDGLSWTLAPGDGVLLEGIPGGWDEAVKTPFLLNHQGSYLLYYGGFAAEGAGELSSKGIGLATSTDAFDFSRVSAGPVLEGSPGGRDSEAAFSPSVLWWKDQAWMIFTGYCGTDCGSGEEGYWVLGASSDDGVNWRKNSSPILDLEGSVPDWAQSGVSDAEIIEGAEGLFYLFFSTAPHETLPGEIGVARSPHPFGPWEIDPRPILEGGREGEWDAGGVFSPTALIEGDRARMWYVGQAEASDGEAIGYAEAVGPVMNIETDWKRSEANPIALPFGWMEEGQVDVTLADPTVLWDEEDQIYKAWWSATVLGIYGFDGPPVNGIRYAESPDGIQWTVSRELAFAASALLPNAWDFNRGGKACVLKIPSNPPEHRYLLYYSGANTDACMLQDAPCYQIGLAWSEDGMKFSPLPAEESPYGERGLVLRGEDVLNGVPGVSRAALSDPSVVVEADGSLRMWMSSSAEGADGEILASGISLVTSDDGIHWRPAAENPLSSLVPSGEGVSAEQPSVLFDFGRGRYEIWLTADRSEEKALVPATIDQTYGFRHATSMDGVHWIPDEGGAPDFRWDPVFPAERWGLTGGVDVILHEGRYMMYYAAFSADGVPESFTVSTRAGMVPAVAGLSVAIRSAVEGPREAEGRAGG